MITVHSLTNMITVGLIVYVVKLFKVGQTGCNFMKNKETNIMVTRKVSENIKGIVGWVRKASNIF